MSSKTYMDRGAMRQMSIDIGQQIFDQMVSIMSDRFSLSSVCVCPRRATAAAAISMLLHPCVGSQRRLD